MRPLYRTTQVRRPGAPMPFLELDNRCDECGRSRSVGNHRACSKKRQARYAMEKGYANSSG